MTMKMRDMDSNAVLRYSPYDENRNTSNKPDTTAAPTKPKLLETSLSQYIHIHQPHPHHFRNSLTTTESKLRQIKRNEFGYYECPWKSSDGDFRCVHRFLTPTSLAAHYFTAHEHDPNRIYCCGCRTRFRTVVELEKHNLAVHVNMCNRNNNEIDEMDIDHGHCDHRHK